MLDRVLSRLRQTHCRSTHQFIAVDALRHVDTEAGRRLASWMTFHHRDFLAGANDPDRRFRDFQNHVVHVTDGYWGGAPRVAHVWYDRMLARFGRGDMAQAVRAAGILCHYFSDPFTPLHTEQSQRERVLHGPIEYAINVSYRELFDQWKRDPYRRLTLLSDSRVWLGETILRGSLVANGHYWTLLSDFDLDAVVDDPRDCFGGRFVAANAEMLGRSVTGLARVFERAADDWQALRGERIPRCRWSRPWIRDVLGWLPNQIGKRRWQARQHRRVKRIVNEFHRRGEVIDSLPTEIDIVERVINVNRQERRRAQERRERNAAAELPRATIPFRDDALPERLRRAA